ALGRAGLLSVSSEVFRTPEGRDVTYRKAAITHEGREPGEATLDTVVMRDGTADAPLTKGPARRKVSSAVEMSGKQRRLDEALTKTTATTLTQRSRSEPSFAKENGQRQRPAVAPAVRPAPRPVAVAAVAEFNAAQAALDGRLRAWRSEQAARAGLPSFFILADSSLRNIVLARPQSLDDLRAVRGVALDKVDRFGAEVVDLCRV
ncbi:MAG TPA: HRDC domain-containing protein, partial [Acidobacteriaceae bacterium]|nr:HRDC domain-containing protein [Acidobacteriaceae bacterium]